MSTQKLSLLLLLTIGFSLGPWLQPRFHDAPFRRRNSDQLMDLLLGDGRKLLAAHFFTKADVYFHSGYYPSIFDQKKLHESSQHLAQEANEAHEHEHQAHGKGDAHEDHDDDDDDFLGPPKDWIDRFSRHFYITKHTHLAAAGAAREILPWLKLSAELDPHQIETYTVSAYWLRSQLGKVDEAESFLREGLRANPDSPEILLELGRLYLDSRKDVVRARNVLELALRKIDARAPQTKPEADRFITAQVLATLVGLEEAQGNTAAVIRYLERLQPISVSPETIGKQIETLRQSLKPGQ